MGCLHRASPRLRSPIYRTFGAQSATATAISGSDRNDIFRNPVRQHRLPSEHRDSLEQLRQSPWSNSPSYPTSADRPCRLSNGNKVDPSVHSCPFRIFRLQQIPDISHTYGKVALQCGPLVYVMEQINQDGSALSGLSIGPLGRSAAEMNKNVLASTTPLKFGVNAAEKSVIEEPPGQPFAWPLTRTQSPVLLNLTLYVSVANREPCPTEVWIPAALNNRYSGGPATASLYCIDSPFNMNNR